MKRYAVVFEEPAQADLRQSYDWGHVRGAYVGTFHQLKDKA